MLRIYPYGLNQNRIRQASRHLNVPAMIVNELLDADALFTLRTYYRKRPQVIADAERRGIPIYVLRNNTVVQMENYLADIFGLSRQDDMVRSALAEAQTAIQRVHAGERDAVQLTPQTSYVRRLQHQMAREANVLSRSAGNEPQRRVTIHGNH